MSDFNPTAPRGFRPGGKGPTSLHLADGGGLPVDPLLERLKSNLSSGKLTMRGAALMGDIQGRSAVNETNRYGIDTQATTAANTNATNRYGIDTQAATAANTNKTNLYGIDTQAATAANTNKTNLYGIDTQAASSKYNSDNQVLASKYGADTQAATSKYNSDNSLTASQYGADVGFKSNMYSTDGKNDPFRFYGSTAPQSGATASVFGGTSYIGGAGGYGQGASYGTEFNAKYGTQPKDKTQLGFKHGGSMRPGQSGTVPGTGKGDKINAKYEPGEFVVSNAMLEKNPGLREQLHSLRADALADKGMTPEQADAKAVGPRGFIRAMTGYSEGDPGSRLGVQTLAEVEANADRVTQARELQRTEAELARRLAQEAPLRAAVAEAEHGARVNPAPNAPAASNYISPGSASHFGSDGAQAPHGIAQRIAPALDNASRGFSEFSGASGQNPAWISKAASTARGFTSGALKLAGRAATPLAVGMEGYDVARVVADPNASKIDVATQVAQGTGRLGLAGAGAGAGAALGTAVFPGVGTVIGGLAGGAAAYYGANKLIEGGRALAGSDTSTPADRAPGFFPKTDATPGSASMSSMTDMSTYKPRMDPSQYSERVSQSDVQRSGEPAPANPNQINVTRQPNGTMSFSGGPNIGKDGGDISYAGPTGFKPSGFGVSTPGSEGDGRRTMEMNNRLASEMRADRMAQDAAAAANAPPMLVSQFERRNAEVSANSRYDGPSRQIALKQLAAMDAQDAQSQKGAIDRQQRYADGLSSAAANAPVVALKQREAAMAEQKQSGDMTVQGFQIRGLQQIEALRAAYDKADAKDKPALAEQISVLMGKSDSAKDRFIPTGGGQEWSAEGNVMRTVPQRIFDAKTRQYVDQGDGQPSQSTKPVTKAEYDKLPKGAKYTAPNGSILIKG